MNSLNNLKRNKMIIIKTISKDLTFYEVIKDGYSNLYFNIIDLLKDYNISILIQFKLN